MVEYYVGGHDGSVCFKEISKGGISWGDQPPLGRGMIRLGKREQQTVFTYCVYVLLRETFCFPGDSDWRRQMVCRFGGRSLEKAQGDVGEGRAADG